MKGLVKIMEKMTNKKALNYVLANYEVPTEVKEKIEGMIAQLDKKSGAERKPTATQKENVAYADAIVTYLKDTGKSLTISDIIKEVAEVSELTNQRVSAIVRQLKDAGTLLRTEEKRKAYFSYNFGE
jgi:ABC-type Na+ transport system ATPase subunit NatA